VNKTDANHVEDVPVLEMWKRLKSDPKAVLVDVRTRAEWAFVGVPDLSSLGRDVLLIEWQTFPDNRVATDFADRLEKALTERGVQKATRFFSFAAPAAAAGWLQKQWLRRVTAIA
jgi:hypothetical protein